MQEIKLISKYNYLYMCDIILCQAGTWTYIVYILYQKGR